MALYFSQQPTLGWYSLQSKLDQSHRLYRLGDAIDWDRMQEVLQVFYKSRGRRQLPIRLMIGLHIIKHLYNLSDAKVVGMLKENIYWMHFCDISPDWLTGAGKKILDRSSMSRFRGRIGAKGMSLIEGVIREQLLEAGLIEAREMTTDSTVVEKHIAYPTDSNLLDRGRKKLVQVVSTLKKQGVKVKGGLRNYAKKGKRAILGIIKLGKDRQERIEKHTMELAKMAQHTLTQTKKELEKAKRRLAQIRGKVEVRVEEQLRRSIAQGEKLCQQVKQVIHQSRQRFKGVHIKDKLYAYHEAHVTAVVKGKRSKPREYGIKVNVSIDTKGFVVNHEEYTKNKNDSKLLDPALKCWEEVTGALPKQLNADRGYLQKRSQQSRRYQSIPQVCIPWRGKTKNPDHRKAWYKRGMSNRPKIEATIGHLKQDHGMGRSRYRGFAGDRMTVGWATAAWNLNKWMKMTA